MAPKVDLIIDSVMACSPNSFLGRQVYPAPTINETDSGEQFRIYCKKFHELFFSIHRKKNAANTIAASNCRKRSQPPSGCDLFLHTKF